MTIGELQVCPFQKSLQGMPSNTFLEDGRFILQGHEERI